MVMNLSQSIAYAGARGFDDWTDADALEQTSALIRADDYIVTHYWLRSILSEAERTRRDAAQFLIARDLLTSSAPVSVRAAAAVKKESKEGAGFKKSVEYGDAPSVLYPDADALLAPLCIPSTPSTPGYVIARLVR